MERKVYLMKINEGLTKINFTDKNSTARIKYIVIHYTGNNGDTAQNNIRYFQSDYRGASAHYFVDEKEIWRSVTDEDIAWHCGAKSYRHPSCRNSNSIGIEMCSRKDKQGKYYFKPEVILSTIELTKELMQKYKIPIENVIRHHDVTGKICPEPFVRENKQWLDFKAALMKKPEVPKKEEKKVRLYNTVAELPTWAQPTIQRLVDKGILNGTGTGLGLTEDMVRMLVLTERMIDQRSVR